MIRRAPLRQPEPIRPWESVRQSLARRHDVPEPVVARRGASMSVNAGRPDHQDAPPWGGLNGSVADERQAGETVGDLHDPEDLDVSLFGPEPLAGAPEQTSDGSPAHRRHVSVRLPAREHELLRQFARVSGSTQQDILRLSLLSYMIEELRKRLNGAPNPAKGRMS